MRSFLKSIASLDKKHFPGDPPSPFSTRYDSIEELKALAWEVNGLQTELIDLGDAVLKERVSFASWIRSGVLRCRLPFRQLSTEASTLAKKFEDQELRLRSFESAGLTSQRCHQKEFLLQYARDRQAWMGWLFEANEPETAYRNDFEHCEDEEDL